MKISHFAFAAALFGAVSATAQSTERTPGSMDKADKSMKTCLMDTDAAAMKSLGLSADQVAKVESIQTSCKADMKNMDGTKDPARADKMEKHTAALKDVLTPEQHSKWVAWCNERTTKTQVDQ